LGGVGLGQVLVFVGVFGQVVEFDLPVALVLVAFVVMFSLWGRMVVLRS